MSILTAMHIWLNGRLVPEKEAMVPVTSHALHYGTSAFEGIRFYGTERGPAIFRLPEHVKRLRYSAKRLAMNNIPSEKKLTEAIVDTVVSSGRTSGYIRPLIYYGEGGLGLSVAKNDIGVAVIVLPWKDYLPPEGVSVKTSSWRRMSGAAFDPRAKIGGPYVNPVMAHSEVVRRGVDEALLLDEKGYVAEGSAENIFAVKDNKIVTPKEGCILPGITRDTIMRLARDRGYAVAEKNILPEELRDADECFMVGTAAEVTPVVRFDGEDIGEGKPGKVTREFARYYKNVVSGKEKKYVQWLTFTG